MEDVKKKKKMKILVDLYFHTSKLLICFVGFFAFASQYCYLPESSCTVFTVSAFMLAVNRKASFYCASESLWGLVRTQAAHFSLQNFRFTKFGAGPGTFKANSDADGSVVYKY